MDVFPSSETSHLHPEVLFVAPAKGAHKHVGRARKLKALVIGANEHLFITSLQLTDGACKHVGLALEHNARVFVNWRKGSPA